MQNCLLKCLTELNYKVDWSINRKLIDSFCYDILNDYFLTNFQEK